ncbi:Geminin coiled-coil domain-containing protein 1 [Varanus komodoensis]|uniref:Geminin coiled-coil domain containing n=1 Tax=Varanus komodoensis TaxID=61221 RepID=A0A8D2ILD7_VARKO|nr:Geminin coiled-coil domain-containing protein 1 [Varanus komodoensis]
MVAFRRDHLRCSAEEWSKAGAGRSTLAPPPSGSPWLGLPGAVCRSPGGPQRGAVWVPGRPSCLVPAPQLQDTLSQKEEELARMQEENRHLRQFLSSALVKQLEEKTKKLLLQNGRPARAAFKSGKRRLKPESPLPPEAAHPQKARRNLLDAFSACEEPPGPAVDRWVLQTLGLKDVDTIDRSPASANYSASAVGLEPGPFPETLDLGCCDALPAAFGRAPLPSLDSAGDAGREPLPCPKQPPALPRPAPLPPSGPPLLPGGSPRSADGVLPARMDVAFSTSLSPHCNVRTHTFRQGQAFVRREEDGGWKLTWVPKQPE